MLWEFALDLGKKTRYGFTRFLVTDLSLMCVKSEEFRNACSVLSRTPSVYAQANLFPCGVF